MPLRIKNGHMTIKKGSGSSVSNVEILKDSIKDAAKDCLKKIPQQRKYIKF